MTGDAIRVLQREAVARHRAHAHDGVAKRIDGEVQQAEQIANFFALEEAPEMEDRNVACFQRRGDLIEASVGAAEHGLVPQPHTCAFELADARRQARGFIVERFEAANLRHGSARRRGPPRAPSVSMPWEAPIRGAMATKLRTIWSVER